MAFGEINNDGNMDIVILNVGNPPTLLIKRTENTNHRVSFKLVGKKSNRAAIGARVMITAGKLSTFDEVRAGSSYLSQNDLRIHFGLGEAKKMEKIEVRWLNGATETLQDIAADASYTIVEGEGIRHIMQLPPVKEKSADALPK